MESIFIFTTILFDLNVYFQVVCEVCKHVSVTYEPFMYLSVPLPHAMERQLSVTYIPANSDAPVRCVVSLNKQSRIGKLKEELLKTLGKEDVPASNVALAEVLENHIARILVRIQQFFKSSLRFSHAWRRVKKVVYRVASMTVDTALQYKTAGRTLS